MCVCVVYVSLTHLWNIRWDVCSIMSTLGFSSQMFRKMINQELAWSSILQDVHKDQNIPTIKNQAKDCTISRQLDLKILKVTKLGFWSTEASKEKFFIWARANTSRHYSRGSHTSFKSIHKFKIASKGSLNAHLKIRVSPIKFHLVHKGQNWNFCKYQVSWPIIQGNMVHCCI